jgi:hypothetical protein
VKNENNSLQRRNPKLVETSIVEPKLQITSPIKDVQEHLDSIVEYAKEPLLTLIEACAPLAIIIDHLSVYVGLALNETPREPADGLTFDESAAIRLYTIEWNE